MFYLPVTVEKLADGWCSVHAQTLDFKRALALALVEVPLVLVGDLAVVSEAALLVLGLGLELHARPRVTNVVDPTTTLGTVKHKP